MFRLVWMVRWLVGRSVGWMERENDDEDDLIIKEMAVSMCIWNVMNRNRIWTNKFILLLLLLLLLSFWVIILNFLQ